MTMNYIEVKAGATEEPVQGCPGSREYDEIRATSNCCMIKHPDVADGPGVRVSVFLAGCPHHCKGCFNEETWPFDAGEPFTEESVKRVVALLDSDSVAGLTILGGEPMDPRNQEATYGLCRRVRRVFGERKTIWIYTGYRLEDIPETGFRDGILKYADVIVDGPFVEELKDISLRWRGSSNQRVLAKDDRNRWTVRDVLEDGQVGEDTGKFVIEADREG